MKKLRILLLSLASLSAALAGRANLSTSYLTESITITGGSYTLAFGVSWSCDDYHLSSAPGRIELWDGGGQVGRVTASVYGGSGPWANASLGSVTDLDGFIAIYNGDGTPADGGMTGTWRITGIPDGNYTLRFYGYANWDDRYQATTVWTDTFRAGMSPPSNTPPSIALLAPGNQTVTAGTALTLTSQATDPDGNLSGHNLDIQRPAGDWNFQGGFATGEPYQGGPVGSAGDSTRSASFTFIDLGTYYVRAAADDGSGWVQSATVAVTVVAPPPVQFALATSAGPGGGVSPGGTLNAGSWANVTATPDATHNFAGWSGDAGGTANPLGFLMDGDKSVQANFTLKSYLLTTSASSGGGVTAGGAYPPGTTITVTATPDAAHYFTSWAGDAGGTAPSIAVTLDRAKFVQAVFTAKDAQTITFAPPGDHPLGSPAFALAASATSGLPVVFTVLSGPATISGNTIQVTGPGAVTLQASQPGDGVTLAASPVTQSFNVIAAASLKYRAGARTLLQTARTGEAIPYILQSQP